ncbi:hypothetical protein NDU88_004168 [Pleurodeles waltl]|uniref:Uncharacterized protein n=1 Tax=Pleurodeles waltl TaxID=8319 RepID=A0AAV7WUB4_PLEWA|nr:hypothetical protein NDU88_004168 [Pleurodeles waltl]
MAELELSLGGVEDPRRCVDTNTSAMVITRHKRESTIKDLLQADFFKKGDPATANPRSGRLQLLIVNLVLLNHSGSMPIRQEGDNAKKDFHLLGISTTGAKEAIIVTLGAEKAFSRVNWDIMADVLE